MAEEEYLIYPLLDLQFVAELVPAGFVYEDGNDEDKKIVHVKFGDRKGWRMMER